MKSMNRIPVELRAVLGTSHITLREIMDLQLGDVIQLDQDVNEKTMIMSGQNDWFLGTLGKLKNHRAIRVDEVLLEGVIDNES
jgi:flagellar motor switch protein FliM